VQRPFSIVASWLPLNQISALSTIERGRGSHRSLRQEACGSFEVTAAVWNQVADSVGESIEGMPRVYLHVLLTDIRLLGLTGPQLARLLLADLPGPGSSGAAANG
jgi:hypothetical protein